MLMFLELAGPGSGLRQITTWAVVEGGMAAAFFCTLRAGCSVPPLTPSRGRLWILQRCPVVLANSVSDGMGRLSSMSLRTSTCQYSSQAERAGARMKARRAKTRRFSGLVHDIRPPLGRALNCLCYLKAFQQPF